MNPIRKNFYNKDIYMIHQDKLIAILGKVESSLLKEQIRELLEEYKIEKNYLNELPYELRSWPNCYIGLSKDDELSSSIIELAIQDSMDDSVSSLYFGDLIYACGCAYLEENYELANELIKIKEFLLPPFYSGTIKNILQVVAEDTLDYLLAFTQTRCKITNDKSIVFYNGEKFVVLDTLPNYELEDNMMYSNALLNYRK